MAEEKIIDASKQENKSQDKFADERLTEKQLENVAGGIIGGQLSLDMNNVLDSRHHTGKK